MPMPMVFRNFAGAFHQDVVEFHGTFEAAVDAVVDEVPVGDCRELADFIDTLLTSGPDVCERVWEESPTSVLFSHAEGLMLMLADCRDRLRARADRGPRP
ncbi:hypothetical protein EYW49_09810 [Siculibacillus lacustris]|uniref:CdiI immunity protein domain-containing protein n=1 Tax=Siculibacillus lacustris TaxID=1549641 RepID=A0A4Q9VR65_9HYPH|nr:hypothetical protein [Siculibacillus lacustris]TBW38233.1 hypothetical protein EYW49_09810 [Siculibacillus lacustris]